MESMVEKPVEKGTTKIKKLVLDGFKSFGKYTELVFGDDFNVIVGPNGSGKSNVLDALCFVLGKSSSKQLRAEKSANLIYNGGKTKQPGNGAEVSIVFDNKENVFPINDEEVKVTRLVRKDGASKYKINNQTKTRQEVLELLSSAKIDPDGYNIILQGDIIRLVEMSPIERRQIIEEIAGIGMYEEKKAQALNELEKVGQKLNEADIILKERESYLKDLKKDRDHALKYKDLSDKIKQNKGSYLKHQLNKNEKEKSELDERAKKHKSKFDDLTEKAKKLRDSISQKKLDMNKLSKDIEEKGEVEQVKLQKEVENLKVEVATKKTKLSNLNTERERVSQRKVQLEKNKLESKGKHEDLKEQEKSLEAQKEAVKKTIDGLIETIKAFKEKHNLLDSSSVDSKFESLDKTAESKQQTLQQLREKQQELVREKDKLEFQSATIDERIEKIAQLEAANKEELESLKHKKNEFKKLVLELNELLNQDSKDASSLAKARSELHHSLQEEQTLSIKHASMKDHIASNSAVKTVLDNKEKFGTIFGTIAELGSSDEKYSIALETAAGRKIHSLVVDSDKTAAAAIKFLKMSKLGSATFLPLNKMKQKQVHEETKSILKLPGVHGLAIDLIEFSPEFKTAFSYVFENSVIVDNIETARKIGIGKAKMVTLDGDVCEVSGAMTGGFRHQKAGSFKEKSMIDKLEKTRAKVSELQTDLDSIDKRRKDNEDRIARIRELKANLEGEIIKQEKSLHLDSGDIESTKSFKEELKHSIKKVAKDLQELEESLRKETEDLTKLKIERQQLRDKISEMRNPRVLAELNAFEEKKKSLEQEQVRIETEAKNLSARASELLERDEANIETLLKMLKDEDASFEKGQNELSKELQRDEKELSIKEKEQSVFFSKFKELFEKRNKLNDEVNDCENKILGIDEFSRKEELSINLLSIEEAKVKAQFASLSAEFEQYQGIELNLEKPEEQLKKEIAEFEKMVVQIGSVNMRALELYDTAEREYLVLVEKKKVLVKEKDDVLSLMLEIEKNKQELFMKTLSAIDVEFQRIFEQLMTKGKSYLELENPQKPFEGGLHINVKLTGNKFLDIRSLSGGEKTMTALSFLFALQEHEPATFYVLDEVDAALDKHNSEKLAKLIRSYCSKAQYVVISHNDALIAEGDILYGVSMNPDAGLSTVVSLKV